jgi:hypothetical protein
MITANFIILFKKKNTRSVKMNEGRNTKQKRILTPVLGNA